MPVPPFVILASNSPRRRELLSLTGWSFISSPANIDETPLAGEKPDSYVGRLAREKALSCRTKQSGLILAADTIVVDAGQLLGKPANAADAACMLRQLRGHTHQVMTAFALLDRASNHLEQGICVTDVPMRRYSDDEIQAYIDTGDPLDKAGAYAIQHAGFHPVEKFQGCFSSVMGLPLCHIARLAARFDLPVSTDMVAGCEKTNRYTCPIHMLVVGGAEIG